MLCSTGTKAEKGPLMDFHQDMQNNLPPGVKRSDTDQSREDEFVDAQE